MEQSFLKIILHFISRRWASVVLDFVLSPTTLANIGHGGITSLCSTVFPTNFREQRPSKFYSIASNDINHPLSSLLLPESEECCSLFLMHFLIDAFCFIHVLITIHPNLNWTLIFHKISNTTHGTECPFFFLPLSLFFLLFY